MLTTALNRRPAVASAQPAPARLPARAAVAESAAPAVWAVVVFGLLLRLYHLARDPSIWHDEAALILNAVGKDFAELFGPLFYSEAAPPLFLWVERAAFLVLGDSAFALRLCPFLASGAALVLLVPLARQVLPRAGVPWAVLLLACSDRLLWHACEAKPYSSDTLVAVFLGLLYCGTESWRLEPRCLLFAGLAPGLMLLAYPACFLYGGVLLALADRCWPYRHTRVRLAYGILVGAVLAAFAALYFGPIQAQRCAPMEQCWQGAFPPWERPWAVPGWLVVSTVGAIDYCCRPEGGLLLIPMFIGAARLWRGGRRDVVALLLAPLLLALCAACLRAYPFTGARILAYAAPGMFLLAAAGVPPILAWAGAVAEPIGHSARLTATGTVLGGVRYVALRTDTTVAPRRPRLLSRAVVALVLVQLLLPVGWAVYRVCDPWYRADFPAVTEFLRRQRQPGDQVVCEAWEGAYYFRPWNTCAQPPQRRWLVVAAKRDPEWRRAAGRRKTHGDWRTVAAHDFVGVTVFLQEPADDDGVTPSEPPAGQ